MAESQGPVSFASQETTRWSSTKPPKQFYNCMRYLSIWRAVERNVPPSPDEIAKMGELIEEMMKKGELIATEGCLPSALGARVRRSPAMENASCGRSMKRRHMPRCVLSAERRRDGRDGLSSRGSLALLRIGRADSYPMTTRRAFVATAAATLIGQRLPDVALFAGGLRPRPSPAQLEWQRDELAMFLHFGVNTFTDREWGDGREDPAIFNPTQLDARQWARSAREAGFRTLVLTAKHHDGFCLWPTKTTDHSVVRSAWRNGHGDVVRELVDACRAEQLKVGLYLSPWDRHEPSYGDSDRYNALYRAQLTELLTQYGVIQEVWFDGANGEGPNGR